MAKLSKRQNLIDTIDQRLQATNQEVEILRNEVKALPEHQNQIDALTQSNLAFNEELDLHQKAINLIKNKAE